MMGRGHTGFLCRELALAGRARFGEARDAGGALVAGDRW